MHFFARRTFSIPAPVTTRYEFGSDTWYIMIAVGVWVLSVLNEKVLQKRMDWLGCWVRFDMLAEVMSSRELCTRREGFWKKRERSLI